MVYKNEKYCSFYYEEKLISMLYKKMWIVNFLIILILLFSLTLKYIYLRSHVYITFW